MGLCEREPADSLIWSQNRHPWLPLRKFALDDCQHNAGVMAVAKPAIKHDHNVSLASRIRLRWVLVRGRRIRRQRKLPASRGNAQFKRIARLRQPLLNRA